MKKLKGHTMNAKANTKITCNLSALLQVAAQVAAMGLLVWMSPAPAAHGQGTLTFSGTQEGLESYYEQGFWFQDVLGSPPAGAGMLVNGQLSYRGWEGSYISISLASGATFGLASVSFWGTYYNGTSVQFNGYFGDGSMVSTTFSVPYDFQWNTYQFGSQFSSGLVRVDIPNNPWAMDNLVFVPEPSTYALLGLGLAVLAFRKFNQRRKM